MVKKMTSYDVAVIGAGPAGLASALACRKYDLNVIVVDEFPYAGGRLLGQLYEEPDGTWWNGIAESEKLIEKAQQANVPIELNRSVYHLEKSENGSFYLHTDRGSLKATYVVIATGAAETALPIPGWTLPGVMSIGAAQVMTNVQRVRVGKEGIIVGVNLLSVAIARELQLAGMNIRSIALPIQNSATDGNGHPKDVMEQLIPLAPLAPSPLLRFGSKFTRFSWVRQAALQFYPRKGIKVWDMPIHLRKAVKEINGDKEVESVTLVSLDMNGQPIAGTEEELAVDFVCIAGGLYPLGELAATVGVPFRYIPSLGGHVPIHNERMETPVEKIFVAGNITGIENAKVAQAQGKVAGLSIAYHHLQKEAIKAERETAIEEVIATRKASAIQFHPEITDGREQIHSSYEQLMKTKK